MYASEPMRCEGGLGPRALFYMKVYWFVVPIDSGGDLMLSLISLRRPPLWVWTTPVCPKEYGCLLFTSMDATVSYIVEPIRASYPCYPGLKSASFLVAVSLFFNAVHLMSEAVCESQSASRSSASGRRLLELFFDAFFALPSCIREQWTILADLTEP